ncbi:LysR family transcriptional regulator protein (plasmid) [Rhizobium sp. NXC14]|uniref:LysR family transcriptional regulator n=1 Tax=Rhizobium sp. NXC14 TaxID=1981173 RepID=UPI000A201D04|nr:LysR family transcriptional regulator [Rhizobium sp. NXC14]ARO33672.1 LysR family transcriptional regulator protein [Rhizobium sp. NXC14]
MKSLDPLEGIAAFLTVGKHLSFTKAAEELRMSRATVGTQVQALEAKLGVRLLHRSTRSVVLTEPGVAYYQSLTGILPQIKEAERAALSYQHEVVGRLKVTVPPEFAQLHMAPIIAEFLKQNPAVSIDITFSHRAVNLIEEGYDLAIRGTIVVEANLITRHIGDSPMIICASPDYLERYSRPSEPMDLANHSCLHFSGLRWGNVWMFSKGEQSARVPIVPRYLANDGLSLRDVAVAGAGVTLLPMFEIAQEIREGRLVRVLDDWTIGSVPIHAVYPANKNIASKVRRFTDFLVKRLPKDAIA